MDDKKLRLKLNSNEKLEELTQEIYNQYCKTLTEIDNEIRKLMSSTNLAEEDFTMDDKAKYFKAMHDLQGDKKAALQGKTEVAKLMLEVIKHNGDGSEAVNDKNFGKRTSLNLNDLRAAMKGGTDDGDTYNLKKN